MTATASSAGSDLDEEAIANLAQIAGIDIPPDRLAQAAARLAEMYVLAADLDGLDLSGHQPAAVYDPRWDDESGESGT